MVLFVVTARPSYARVKTVLEACQALGVPYGVIACGSALLDRYGRVVDEMKADGINILEELYTTHEGEILVTSAAETGALTMALASAFSCWHPRAVVVIADRHEVLAPAIAAAYLHLPLWHLQGGETSGSIDQKVRWAITQLADVHCVATPLARHRVKQSLKHVSPDAHVYWTGCPSIDLAKRARDTVSLLSEIGGSGPRIDPAARLVVLLYHPVTARAELAGEEMRELLDGTRQCRCPRLILWPGQDAGAGGISKAIRQEVLAHPELTITTLNHMTALNLLRLLYRHPETILIGNSSLGIREASYLGVKTINVGDRQQDRAHAENVRHLPLAAHQIREALEGWATQKDRLPSSTLYGDGRAGQRIAKLLRSGG